MKKKYMQLKAEWEFTNAVREKLLQPNQCKTVKQIAKCMEDLHFLINEFKMKYNIIPSSATTLFEKYSTLQQKLIYEKFIKEDSF